jgi:large subunit ribosomal protein L46
VHPVTTALPEYTTKSGILLSRPPILTRPLTKFETSFHFYQKRLNERLALPFTRYFYFKKDTPLDLSFKAQTKARNGSVARELGGYDAYGKEAWNDEIIVGSDIDSEKSVREAAVRDAEGLVRDDGEAVGEGLERPRERFTDADVKNDVRTLDRKLARTLFLVVKGREGWKFPTGEVVGRENLHQVS